MLLRVHLPTLSYCPEQAIMVAGPEFSQGLSSALQYQTHRLDETVAYAIDIACGLKIIVTDFSNSTMQ